jgi:dTDP-4-amino-4,6-dideoxygalactose transaminase
MKRRVAMGNLAAQLAEIRPQLDVEWDKILLRSSYIGGESVKAFEASFASYTGAQGCVGVGNGTDALEIILQALDLPRGSKVLVPANSFVATAEAVLNSGLKLGLVDVADDFGFDRDDLLNSLDSTVSAVIAVHLYGLPQDLSWLIPELKARNIHLLEDCAQAHGAKLGSKHVGTLGAAGAFSFYPGKNLGALGDAGAIVANDSELLERIRRIANHGRLSKFDHALLGRNSRLDSLQAAVLDQKLKRLDGWNDIRRRNAELYSSLLSNVQQVVLPPTSSGFAVFHHFVIRVAHRDRLASYLSDNGIETGIHYPKSIDEMPAFFEPDAKAAINSRRISGSVLSLPVAESVTEEDIEYVASVIKSYYS